MNGKEYPVGTIQEMAAIPEEARPRFLAELPSLLDHVASAQQAQDLVSEMFGGKAELVMKTPIWVDDDKGEATFTVSDPLGGKLSATVPIKDLPK